MGAYILTCLLLLPRFFWELGWIHTFLPLLIFLLPESLGGAKKYASKTPTSPPYIHISHGGHNLIRNPVIRNPCND